MTCDNSSPPLLLLLTIRITVSPSDRDVTAASHHLKAAMHSVSIAYCPIQRPICRPVSLMRWIIHIRKPTERYLTAVSSLRILPICRVWYCTEMIYCASPPLQHWVSTDAPAQRRQQITQYLSVHTQEARRSFTCSTYWEIAETEKVDHPNRFMSPDADDCLAMVDKNGL